jgi:UDP-glucuronate 4-epimerase
MMRISKPNPIWSGDWPDPATGFAHYRIFNIGNNRPEELLRFIEVLEKNLGRSAVKNLMPIQPGDVPATYADVGDLTAEVCYRPHTPIEEGIEKFVTRYKTFYK